MTWSDRGPIYPYDRHRCRYGFALRPHGRTACIYLDNAEATTMIRGRTTIVPSSTPPSPAPRIDSFPFSYNIYLAWRFRIFGFIRKGEQHDAILYFWARINIMRLRASVCCLGSADGRLLLCLPYNMSVLLLLCRCIAWMEPPPSLIGRCLWARLWTDGF